MRDTVYFVVFDGFAEWQAALALCEIRRPGDWEVRTVGFSRAMVTSMGGLAVKPDLALEEGVLALARSGLLDQRRHTGNWAGQLAAQVPGYRGTEQFDAEMLAVSDDGVISASHLGSIEFAREVIHTLDLYSA